MAEKRTPRKRTVIFKAVLAMLGLSGLVLAFAAGIEVGWRLGFEKGWRDCKNDAKEQLWDIYGDSFWKWYGSAGSAVRKRTSFWLDYCGFRQPSAAPRMNGAQDSPHPTENPIPSDGTAE